MLRGVARNFLSSPGSGGKYAPYILAQSAVAVSVGAVTTEAVLATITVPAGAMGPNGTLRIETVWTMTNGADDKILRVRFSGATGTQFRQVTLTTQTNFRDFVVISNRNATNSQVGSTPAVSTIPLGLTGAGNLPTAAVDTTGATSIVISGQKETAVDTLTLERYLVELLYGA